MPEPTAAPATSTRSTPAQRGSADRQSWTAAELAELREDLVGQAASLRAEIDEAEDAVRAVRRATSGEGSGDEADVGSQTFEREHEQSLADHGRGLLLQVERALARLDDGTYGDCERCRSPIPKARLQAFPRVTLCVACKQREERR